jgi:hypothetical protein
MCLSTMSGYIFFLSFTWLILSSIREYQREELLKTLTKRHGVDSSLQQINGSTKPQNEVFVSPRIAALRRQLYGMTGGQRDVADRLVEVAKRGKPPMGEEWYLEKAIYDLIRDRSR